MSSLTKALIPGPSHLCVTAAAVLTLGGTAAAQEEVALPADPAAVVVELRWFGGYGPPQRDDPALVILADGRVRVAASAPDAPVVEGRVELPRLRRLLHELVHDHHLLDFDAAAVRKEILAIETQRNVAMHVADAGTVRIALAVAERSKTIEYEGPEHYARSYPSVRALQGLCAAQQKLARFAGEHAVGGAAAVERWRELADQALRREHPTRAPLHSEDLAYAERLHDRVVVDFRRIDRTTGGEREQVGVRITGVGDKTPEIRVFVSPAGK